MSKPSMDEKPAIQKREVHHLEQQQAHVDLAHNLAAKVQNPLHGIPKEQLMREAREFAQTNGLSEHSETFAQGALVAQSPGSFEDIPELDEEQKSAIRFETTHKWSVPKRLYFTIILCSIGACVQGWDQTGSNGANLSWPQAFGIPDGTGDANASRNEWLIGLVNSGPYIGACLIGCWLNDPVNQIFGRRGTIFASAVFCVLTPIGMAVSQNWHQLLVCRLLLGIGMGLKGSTVPIFCAENAPANIRGALVMSWQLWTAFGIFLGTVANLILFQVGDIAWRLQMGSAFLPAIPLLLGVYFCPESPRWLMKKGRYQEAFVNLTKLRNHPIQAARDCFYIARQLEIEAMVIGQGSVISRFFELFTIPRVRRATLASFTVMIAQQMCGINIIAFYSSSIFSDAGYSNKQALLASFGFGAVNFVFAFPAIWTIDTFGRRNLLLFTFPNMCWSLLAAGLCFLIPDGNSARIPLIALFIFIFAAFYSPGEGPVPFTYSAEVFPLSHREVGMSWAVATCFFWASVLSLTFPRMVGAMTQTGAFGFYAGLNILALIMIFLWCPETKARTLEELDYVFAVPTKAHMSYQMGKSLPYFIKRWIFFNKSATLEPLYDFSEVEHDPATKDRLAAEYHATHSNKRELA